MKHARLASLFMALALALPASAEAARAPQAIKTDHRVRLMVYQPDEVFKFTGHYRFQSSIEFAPDELIQTISMGDSTSWMLNPSGNRLFLKPLDQDATTNMTLITNKRTYLMELHAEETDDIDDKNMIFVMRFVYPDSGESGTSSVNSYLDSIPTPDLTKHPEKYNQQYTIAGSDDIAPIRIFDDGEFTYFQFRDKNTEVPAFFWADTDGSEALINYRTRGDYIVVERVSKRFTLRHGKAVVCVFNEAKGMSDKQPTGGWF